MGRKGVDQWAVTTSGDDLIGLAPLHASVGSVSGPGRTPPVFVDLCEAAALLAGALDAVLCALDGRPLSRDWVRILL